MKETLVLTANNEKKTKDNNDYLKLSFINSKGETMWVTAFEDLDEYRKLVPGNTYDIEYTEKGNFKNLQKATFSETQQPLYTSVTARDNPLDRTRLLFKCLEIAAFKTNQTVFNEKAWTDEWLKDSALLYQEALKRGVLTWPNQF